MPTRGAVSWTDYFAVYALPLTKKVKGGVMRQKSSWSDFSPQFFFYCSPPKTTLPSVRVIFILVIQKAKKTFPLNTALIIHNFEPA